MIARVVVPSAYYVGRSLARSDRKRKMKIPKITYGVPRIVLYVWYKDGAGNVSDAASDSIILDTPAPTVTITSPTSNDRYSTTNSVIALGGSASDSTSGVSIVT